jgi:hypothetical protein
MSIKDCYIPIFFEKHVTPAKMLDYANQQLKYGSLEDEHIGVLHSVPKMKIPDDHIDQIIKYGKHMKKLDIVNDPIRRGYKSERDYCRKMINKALIDALL